MIDKIIDAKNAVVGWGKKLIKSVKFLASPIGQIIGFLILIAICALILYIMIAVLIKSIAGWAGIELGGIATDNDYKILDQIEENGYDAFIDADQVKEYAAFEYAVLMDVARNIEETGVWEGKEIHSGSQNCEEYTLDEYYQAFWERTHRGESIGSVTNDTSVDIPGTESQAGDDTEGGDSEGSGGIQTGEEVTNEEEPHKTLDFISELVYKRSVDSEKNESLVPYIVVTRYFNKYEYILEGRIEGALNTTNLQTIYPLQYIAEYNSKNIPFETDLGITIPDVETVNYNTNYGTVLFGSTPKSQSKVVYEIPLKLLIDRYLPKSTLLSAWYILKSDIKVNGKELDIQTGLVEPIMDIYNKACLKDENVEVISEETETSPAEIKATTNNNTFIEFERFEIQANRFGLMNERGHTGSGPNIPVIESLSKSLKFNINYDVPANAISYEGGLDAYQGNGVTYETVPVGNPAKLLEAVKVPNTEAEFYVPTITDETSYIEDFNGYFDVDKMSDGDINNLINRISNEVNSSGNYKRRYKCQDVKFTTVQNTDGTTTEQPYVDIYYTTVYATVSSEEKYMYVVREKNFQYMLDVTSRTMPIYLVKNAVTWSKESKYINKVRQNNFDPTNWRFIITGNLYARGLSKLDIGSTDKYRIGMYEEPLKYIRENDVITMFAEWEKTAAEGDMASYTYIRDTYKLINYILKEDTDHKYIPENSYKYLYVPDTIMDCDDILTEKIFWMERMGVTEGDPLTLEEQMTYRNRKNIITWQNVEYSKYDECQGDDGKTKVYALFPLGEPLVRAIYEADANGDIGIASRWGAYNPPKHAGVDLYGRKRLVDEIVEDNDVYEYELNRLTEILGNAENAKMKLTETIAEKSKLSPIVAVAPGIVVASEYTANSGFRVKIQHDKNYVVDGVGEFSKGTCTWYMHLVRWPLVQVGDYVGAGTIIGYEGTTGGSGGNHLHFEVRINGNKTPELPTTPDNYIYPMFNPFYYDEKAFNEDYSLSSEYMSLQRTIVMKGNGTIKNNVPSVALLEDAGSQLVTLDDEAEYTIPESDGYVMEIPSYDKRVQTLKEYFEPDFIKRVINGKSTIKDALGGN